MTPPDSPSALLERAAEAIEFFAKQASPGPWSIGLFGHLVWDVNGEAVASNIGNEADDRWIKTMSPSVAQPLVEWLRTTARFMHFEGGAVSGAEKVYPFLAAKYAGAIAFARAVLGES